MVLILILILLFSSPQQYAYQNMIRGKVINEKNKPVSNLRLRISTIGEKITTDSGEFLIDLPPGITEIEVLVTDNKWKLQYPPDGRIPLLNDQDFVYKIVVKDNIDEIVENYKEIKNVLNDIGIKSEEMLNWIKNYTETESRRISLPENEITEAIERAEKREEPIKEISSALLNYNLAAQNMKVFFSNLIESAMKDHRALRELAEAVINYNNAYRDIEINKFIYQNKIYSNWENQELPLEFISIVDYSTDELHKIYMLELGIFINKINDLNSGILDEEEQENLKSEIKEEVADITRSLEPRLGTLDLKIINFLSVLKDQNIQ